MRLALVTGAFPKLSETFVLEQILQLLDLGHEVEIFAFEDPGETVEHAAVEQQELRARTHYLGYERKDVLNGLGPALRTGGISLASLRHRDALARRLAHGRKGYFDVIYCHFGHIAERARQLRSAGFFEGPLAAVFHAAELTTLLPKLGAKYYEPLFRDAALLLPVSKRWRDKLVELGAPSTKIEVFHMGVDTGKLAFRPRKPVSPPPGTSERRGTPVVLSVGRFVEKKGFENGLRAVALAERVLGRPLRYDLVGDGPLRESLEELAKSQDNTGRVAFHGSRTSQEVADRLAEADVLLAPSVTASDGDQEGIPVILMEAMAVGVPVVASIHSGIPELVSHGESGLLVPERDTDALAQALARLLSEPGLSDALTESARRKVEIEFDSKTLTRDLAGRFMRLSDET